MTPTEKDAMALAAVDSAAHALKYAGAKHEGVQQVIDARAHLANRIAELEDSLAYEVERARAAESIATRAEAELAAARNVLTSIRDSTFRSALILRGMAQRGLDAASGGE